MQTVKTSLLLLVCSACLGACGLKGPLYLPDETSTSEQESVAENSEPEVDTKKKDDLPR